MTNNELALVAILGAATIIFLGLLYYFYVIIPIRNEQKEASKEDQGAINTDALDEHFMPIEKEQLN